MCWLPKYLIPSNTGGACTHPVRGVRLSRTRSACWDTPGLSCTHFGVPRDLEREDEHHVLVKGLRTLLSHWQCHQKGWTMQDRTLCLGWLAAPTSLEAASASFKRCLAEQRQPCPGRSKPPRWVRRVHPASWRWELNTPILLLPVSFSSGAQLPETQLPSSRLGELTARVGKALLSAMALMCPWVEARLGVSMRVSGAIPFATILHRLYPHPARHKITLQPHYSHVQLLTFPAGVR